MSPEFYLGTALLVIAAALLLARLAAASQALKYRGRMLVTCPETRKPAVVKVGMMRAAARWFINRGHLELSECSRWEGHPDCDQACLFQIERAPKDHRVWNVASEWFAGKECVYCHKAISPLSHIDHAPALMRIPDRKTIEWTDLPAERLPEAFADCMPVCWNCHMTEMFLRRFPDKTVQRAFRH